MNEPDDTPTHWVRDLLTGAAIVLAVVQTVRLSGVEAEASRLHAALEAERSVHVVAKSAAPLLRVVSVQRQGSEIVVKLAPLRDAVVDVAFFDAGDHEIAGCSQAHVPLPPELRCSAPSGEVSASLIEN
jgi:hypothetical protein